MEYSAFALDYNAFMYKTNEAESFSSILKKFVKDPSVINAKTPLVKKTMENNPHVLEWETLPPDTNIELYISDDFIDLDKYKKYEAKTLSQMEDEEERKKKSTYPIGLKGSVFYLSSLGIFKQKSSDLAETNFKQNSPFSLGTAFTFYPPNKLYSVSSSVYYSYLVAAANSLTSEKVTIPPEIGGNVYGEYRWQKYNITLFSGVDYEKFSTFNLRGLQNDSKVYVDGVGVTYLTFGIAKAFSMFNKQFFTKASVAKSLISDYTNNAPQSLNNDSDHIDSGKYSGFRYLFYLNYKFSDKIYLHSLLKYHSMSGPSDLSALRIGVGVGYILF